MTLQCAPVCIVLQCNVILLVRKRVFADNLILTVSTLYLFLVVCLFQDVSSGVLQGEAKVFHFRGPTIPDAGDKQSHVRAKLDTKDQV